MGDSQMDAQGFVLYKQYIKILSIQESFYMSSVFVLTHLPEARDK